MALADNKAKIQALLDGINALPNKDEGGTAEPVLQEKSVTPTKEAQTITPDEDYDGLSQVNVGAIPDEYIVPSGTVSITANGTHDVREAESVNVNVPTPEPVMQEKTVTPATTAQTVTADDGYDGLSAVTVEQIPADYVIPAGEKSITENGTHDVAGFASVNVAVESGGSGISELPHCNMSVYYSKSLDDNIVSWTEVDDGIVEFCQDGGGNIPIVQGFPPCNTMIHVQWGYVSGKTASFNVSGGHILKENTYDATIVIDVEAGGSIEIDVIWS